MSDKEYIKDKDAGICYNAMDMYKEFVKENPETDITYPLFKHILSGYNKCLVNMIIEEGILFNPNFNIGKFGVKKIERNFNKKTIDWGETNKLKAKGINQHVYFTDDFYYRIGWDKINCTLKNKAVYRFKPTYSVRKHLVRFIKTNPLAKPLYERAVHYRNKKTDKQ